MGDLIGAGVALIAWRIDAVFICYALGTDWTTRAFDAIREGIDASRALLRGVDEISRNAGGAIILRESRIDRAGDTVSDIIRASIAHPIIIYIVTCIDTSYTLKFISAVIAKIDYSAATTTWSISKYIIGYYATCAICLVEAGWTVAHDWTADKAFVGWVHLVARLTS